MKYSVNLSYTSPHEVIDLARTAELAGFHSITMGEHLLHPVNIDSDYPYKFKADGPRSVDHTAPILDFWTTAGTVLAATTKLRFMSSLYLLPLRHPLISANGAATLAGISNNRFTFGVGTGWMREEYDELGVPWEGRGKRFDEALDIMDKAWRGISEPYEGEHYSFGAMGTNPLPPAPVPLYFGGHSEVAMKRAVRRGSGWICAPKPGVVEEQFRTISEMRRSAGKADEPFEFCAMLKEPDEDLVRELAGIGVDHITVSVPWRPDLANPTDPKDNVATLKDLGAQLHKITASL